MHIWQEKKYLDEQVAKSGRGTLAANQFLLKTGGIMLGNIDMGTNKMLTNSNPTGDKDLARKKTCR